MAERGEIYRGKELDGRDETGGELGGEREKMLSWGVRRGVLHNTIFR